MKISTYSVKRPVTVIMFFCGILLLGLICWGRLPRELFPHITYPQLTIVTTYENAAPEEVETQITKIIEEAIGTVANLKQITSISKEGVSIVIAEFLWGTNMDFAALGLREKIDIIKERLPLDAEEPIVKKYNPFDLPVMSLSITGPYHPARLREITERLIEDELEKVEGVASARVIGGIEREVLVEVDQDKLQASGISLLDVTRSIAEANINYPAGTIKETFTEYLVRTLGEFQEVSEIGKIAVGVEKFGEDVETQEGSFPRYRQLPRRARLEQKTREERKLILLSDIAEVTSTYKDVASLSRYNGLPNITVLIQKQEMYNTIEVAKNVRASLKEIRTRLPKGVKIEVVYDQSKFIKRAIYGVSSAALQGGVLAMIVLFLFLRSFRSSLVVALSIPLSILASFILMYFSGISLNIMSLGGLALGIGMLVDNAIVVMENVIRHSEQGKAITTSASDGAEEVGGAITASTGTTIAIFIPLIFVIGIAGQIFKQLALTITYSLSASLIVALTLIPVMMVLGRGKRQFLAPSLDKKTDLSKGLLSRVGYFFDSLLRHFLKRPWIYLLLTFFVFVLSLNVLMLIDREFMPRVDQGQFIIKVDMPTGTVLEATDKAIREIEETLLDMDDVKSVTVNVGSTKGRLGEEAIETLGSHQGRIMVTLKEKRTHSSNEVIQELKRRLSKKELGAASIEYILQESIFKTGFGTARPVVLEVKGQELPILKKLSSQLKKRLKQVVGLYGIQDSLIPPSPETKVNIIKDKASFYNLSVNDIAQTAHIGIKGYVVSKFKKAGREIDIKVRLRKQDRDDINKLRRLVVHSPLGIDVPLAEVSYFTVGKGPSEIRRFNQERTVWVTANIYRRSLGEVVEDVNRILKKMKLPAGYTIEWAGESKQMRESFKGLVFALVLSFILIYMIMASMFESLWQPFVIMFTVPLSIMGVAIALFVTKTSLSIVAVLGIIILGGIVVNNGIVLIDFVNALRRKGMDLNDALITASKVRLRPILMTALTTVLGLLPLALGIQEGSKIQSPMAITVMGGLIVSSFLTLIIIPVVYLVTQRFLDRFKARTSSASA